MDPATLTEVVVQGPASSDPETLRTLVLRKLDYALARGRCRPE